MVRVDVTEGARIINQSYLEFCRGAAATHPAALPPCRPGLLCGLFGVYQKVGYDRRGQAGGRDDP